MRSVAIRCSQYWKVDFLFSGLKTSGIAYQRHYDSIEDTNEDVCNWIVRATPPPPEQKG